MTPLLRLMWDENADRALPLPDYATDGAAGADLRANLAPELRHTGMVLAPMQRGLVPTGLRVEIPEGYEVQLRPRSGLALKYGIGLPNAPGTIDHDYRGPLGVILINFGSEPYTIAHGDRIAQMIVAPVVQATFELVETLSETVRGAGGFGSTGKGMIAAFALAAALWGIGKLVGAPSRLRWAMVGAVWLGAVIISVTQGGDVRVWLGVGVLAGLVAAYRAALLRLRARAIPPEPPKRGAFSDTEVNRYSRHLLLREIGGQGQKALKQARVLVVGAGGLGSPLLFYLAASGVGRITVMDGDVVENSNLQRQIIHTDARIGMNKAESAALAMRALNPFVTVDPMPAIWGAEDGPLVAEHDLILDGTDNFDTRYLVNRLAAQAGVPLIAAAITQWEGQLGLYHPAAGTACYECVFPVRPAAGLVPSCAEAGVAAPLPGILGAMMATEAVKHLTGAGAGLGNRLLIHDALYAESRLIGVQPRGDCPVCGEHGAALRG